MNVLVVNVDPIVEYLLLVLVDEVEVFYYSDFDSAIIPVSEQRTIVISIGFEDQSLTNIYRASLNRFSATNFHNKVAGYYKI
jgi:hypothetical protein